MNESSNKMMSEISIFHVFQLLLQKLWILVIAFIFFASVVFAYCRYIMVPVYSASASILVTGGGSLTVNERVIDSDGNYNSINNGDITSSQNLYDTLVDILKTPDIFKQLSAQIGNRYSYETLRSKMTAQHGQSNSLFINITFRANDPQEAISLVNQFVDLTPEYISNYFELSNTVVASKADKAVKVLPRTVLFTLGAGMVGAVGAFAIIFLIDFNDRRIKGEEDFTNRFDLPLIGTVPDFDNVSSSGNYRSGYRKYGRYGYKRYGYGYGGYGAYGYGGYGAYGYGYGKDTSGGENDGNK